ncbi:trehalose-6-phosphate synthase [Hymenobacter sp. NBH84]|uniref:trehalose-6-phosphate synthase n=1 Tax=Hymenobacter sp. NBH84 TaxID=2596915 RepID=UPI0027E4493E|nr:trehalose-6-phosphate synthase [Hymenobacter sp. NBH84]
MSRTIIISNRLPTKVQRAATGLTFQPSEGGLATGLGSIYRAEGNVWVGWPGLSVDDPAEQDHVREQLSADSMAPVFLTEAEIRDFYEGFSNSTLWPTFHYFPQYATYEQAHWDAYVAVNEKFCQAVLALAGPDDTIWVHDYQLLLLPEMLRRERPEATIGFFLHIPFPSYELLRALPWGTELVRGMRHVGRRPHRFPHLRLHAPLPERGVAPAGAAQPQRAGGNARPSGAGRCLSDGH